MGQIEVNCELCKNELFEIELFWYLIVCPQKLYFSVKIRYSSVLNDLKWVDTQQNKTTNQPTNQF